MEHSLPSEHRQDATTSETLTNGRDLSRYTSTPREALNSFHNAGLPLKLRTIQRYCRKGKLDCVRIDPETREPTEKKSFDYLIDPNSIPRRIGDMLDRKEFAETTEGDSDATGQDQTRSDTTGRDQTRQGMTPISSVAENGEIEELHDKLQDAETRAAAHKAVALQLRKDRDAARAELRVTDRAVGIFQDRILKLEGDPTFPHLPDALPEPNAEEREQPAD